jgi:hypothetical protein
VHLLDRIGVEKVAHRERHRVDMARRTGDRLCDHIAAAIEDSGGQVAGLAHDRGKTCALERGRLLVNHTDEPVPADFQRYRIEVHDAFASRTFIMTINLDGTTFKSAPGEAHTSEAEDGAS